MAELAQFVAATIQDKATLELLEENKKLQALLCHYSKLEICGKDGKPVLFCAYQRSDGSYTIANGEEEEKEPKSKSFPLANLSDLELRLGGFIVTKLSTSSLCGICQRDGTIQLYLEQNINGKNFTITFDVAIEGWSEERLLSLERVEPEHFVETLMHSFPAGVTTTTIQILDASVEVD